MPPKRRGPNKYGNPSSKNQSKGPGKTFLNGAQISAENLKEAREDLNKLQVTIRFQKVDHYSIIPKEYIGNYISVKFMLKHFNLDLLKFHDKAVVFFYNGNNPKVGKIRNYKASIENGIVTMHLELVNIVNREMWEREFFTEEYFYNEYVLGFNKFWAVNGDKLDELVKPLGLSRKSYEDDPMFKRRVVTYIQMTIKPTNDVMAMLNSDLKKDTTE